MSSLDFSTALQLASCGYRMRYEDWPEGDYIFMGSCGGIHTLYRFHSNVCTEPYEQLPWITDNMLNGKWYFSKRKETKDETRV